MTLDVSRALCTTLSTHFGHHCICVFFKEHYQKVNNEIEWHFDIWVLIYFFFIWWIWMTSGLAYHLLKPSNFTHGLIMDYLLNRTYANAKHFAVAGKDQRRKRWMCSPLCGLKLTACMPYELKAWLVTCKSNLGSKGYCTLISLQTRYRASQS